MAAAVLNGAEGGGGLRAAAGMYEQLKGEWGRKSPNLSKCGEALGRLKVRGASRGSRAAFGGCGPLAGVPGGPGPLLGVPGPSGGGESWASWGVMGRPLGVFGPFWGSLS